MSKAIIFSRAFPAHHPKAGQPTHFVEKILNSIKYYNDKVLPSNVSAIFDYKFAANCKDGKHHTIRASNRWKVGDKFSPRVWSGKPRNSKQIIIAPDIEIKKIWDFEIKCERNSEMPNDISNFCYINKKLLYSGSYNGVATEQDVAKNDGLSHDDFIDWFKIGREDDKIIPTSFSGQIICWYENINY